MDRSGGAIGFSVWLARQAKHQVFLLWKRSQPYRQPLKDGMLRRLELVAPYRFAASRYPGDFVQTSLPAGPSHNLERVIYCFWTGDNELTTNRRRGLESLRERSGVDVRLVTPENLSSYILPEAPLHASYESLSLVHRSDYLRCYFMNFYGGGYSDIKTIHQSWEQAFNRLESSESAWSLGYREVGSNMTATTPGRLGSDVRRHFSILCGNGAFIMKARTPLTGEWYARLLDRMDHFSTELALCPGNERGDNDGYPVEWEDLLANILAPLVLKYHEHVIIDESIRPNFHDYK